MNSLQISTGEKRIAINGDPERVIVFNPSDVLFAERFYRLIGEFQERLTQYQVVSRELDKNKAVDENDLPVNMQERIDLVKEACMYIYEKIDVLFGEGTSLKVFEDALSLDAVTQFFDGITSFIQPARAEKIAKYTNAKPKRARK